MKGGAKTIQIDGRTFCKGVRRLGVLDICGVSVLVVLATAELKPELSDALGIWDSSTATIFVRAGQIESLTVDAVYHEAAHAFLELSGLRNTLKVLLGPKRSKHWDGDDGIEEQLVRQVTPHIVALCGSKPWR